MKTVLTTERIQFTDEDLDWQEAIRRCAAPLLADGSIEQSYVDAAIATALRIGPFFDLGKRIAIPHARPEEGAHAVALSLLRTRKPVLLLDDEKHPIDIFIMLSATDSTSHIGVLQQLTSVLVDDDAVTQLKSATTAEEVLAVFEKTSQ